jgi:hypothetical protein
VVVEPVPAGGALPRRTPRALGGHGAAPPLVPRPPTPPAAVAGAEHTTTAPPPARAEEPFWPAPRAVLGAVLMIAAVAAVSLLVILG